MRNKILSICVILPLIFGLGFVSMRYIHTLSEAYAGAIREMESLARAGDYGGAQRLLTETATAWEKREGLLQIWVCHADTDNVTSLFKGVQVGLTLRDEALLFDRSAALIEALEHLNHRDDLTWSNLL